jgi:hypothetical protein
MQKVLYPMNRVNAVGSLECQGTGQSTGVYLRLQVLSSFYTRIHTALSLPSYVIVRSEIFDIASREHSVPFPHIMSTTTDRKGVIDSAEARRYQSRLD